MEANIKFDKNLQKPKKKAKKNHIPGTITSA